ncbi:hypothetical protein HU200_060470 [Digitaria exilis]|uniref:Uncharacterized protein n=1 Tax=Digitaria exilis TaxID=1010633 RepID=A0A835E1N5_9POAL|nr:hypothetical protein HU200_060470 [Digitaria exilis]
MHLFTCSLSRWCWTFLNIQWDTSLDIMEMIVQSTRSFASRIFREIVIVTVWAIWTHRKWKHIFKEEFSLLLHRANSSLKLELESWFCNFHLTFPLFPLGLRPCNIKYYAFI